MIGRGVDSWTYNWEDERGLHYTSVDEEVDAVIIRPRRMRHILGTVVGGICLAVLLLSVSPSLYSTSRGYGLASVILAVVLVAMGVRLLLRNSRMQTPEWIIASSAVEESPDSRIIRADRIVKVVCRENRGRYVDDPRLVQIYALLRDRSEALLLYTGGWPGRRVVRPLAERLARRWQVPLEIDISSSWSSA